MPAVPTTAGAGTDPILAAITGALPPAGVGAGADPFSSAGVEIGAKPTVAPAAGPPPQTPIEEQLLSAVAARLVGLIEGVRDFADSRQAALVQAGAQLLLAVRDLAMPGTAVADFLVALLRIPAPRGVAALTAADVGPAVEEALMKIAPNLRSAGLLGATAGGSGGPAGGSNGQTRPPGSGGPQPVVQRIPGVKRRLDPEIELAGKPALPTPEECEEVIRALPGARITPSTYLYTKGAIPGTPDLKAQILPRLDTAAAIESGQAPQSSAKTALTQLGFTRVTPTPRLGSLVHTAVKQLYLKAHPRRLICADNLVYGDGEVKRLSDLGWLMDKGKKTGTGKRRSTGSKITDARLALFAEALKFSNIKSTSTLRADLANFDERTLHEIKPTGGAQEAVLQLWSYQAYANAAYDRLGRDLAGRDYLMKEGSWPADPLPPFQVEQDMYAIVFQFPGYPGRFEALPGVILYELYKRPPDEDEQALAAALELLRIWIIADLLRRLGAPPQQPPGDQGRSGGGKVLPFPGRTAPQKSPDEERKAARVVTHALATLAAVVTILVWRLLPQALAFAGAVLLAGLLAALIAAILVAMLRLAAGVFFIVPTTRPSRAMSPEDTLAMSADYLDLVGRAGIA